MKLPVLSAAAGAHWEAALVAALDGADHGAHIVRRCVDVVELLAIAATGQGRAALVAADLRRLDADAVDRLVASEVAVVAVIARGDPAAEERMRAIGIAHVVPSEADPAVVAGVLVAAVDDLRAGAASATTPSRATRAFGDPASSLAIPAGEGAVAPDTEPSRHGSIVAVWGSTGAPGRTTVAVALADELARLGHSSLLVDADVYGATIAAVLGLLDDSPGLAAACRHAAARRLDGAELAALCWQLSPQLQVLTGIPLAARWPELRPAAIEAVLAAGRSSADFVVVDCGFCLETDEELAFDTLAPRRNAATLSVLDAADVIIAVGAADPIGVQRLVRGLDELREAEVTAPVWVVLNKVRRVVVPGEPKAELIAAVERFAGRTPAALLPADSDALDAALATGRTLAEMRPTSPLRRAFVELAEALAGPSAPTAHRRRRR